MAIAGTLAVARSTLHRRLQHGGKPRGDLGNLRKEDGLCERRQHSAECDQF